MLIDVSSSYKMILTEPHLLVTLTIASLTTFSVLALTGLLYGKKFRKYMYGIAHGLKTFVEDLAMLIFTVSFLLFMSLPYGLMLFVRWGLQLYCKLRWGSLGSLVEGNDSCGVVDNPKSLQIIKSLKVLQGDCSLDKIRDRCAKTVGRTDDKGNYVFPKFYQRLDKIWGFYVWKPSNFDINYHMRYLDEKNPHKLVTEAEALDTVSKLSNIGFEPDRANWEILFIPNFIYDYELELDESKRVKKGGLIIRIHHGIGDGFSLMKLIMHNMVDKEENYVAPNPHARPGQKESSWWYKIAVFIYLIFKSPRAMYKGILLKDLNPLHNPKVKILGEKVAYWSDPIDVPWLKEVKNKLGSGMSTILLSAFTGSCRDYMIQEV